MVVFTIVMVVCVVLSGDVIAAVLLAASEIVLVMVCLTAMSWLQSRWPHAAAAVVLQSVLFWVLLLILVVSFGLGLGIGERLHHMLLAGVWVLAALAAASLVPRRQDARHARARRSSAQTRGRTPG